jgi:hypothetical protein
MPAGIIPITGVDVLKIAVKISSSIVVLTSQAVAIGKIIKLIIYV